MLGNESTKHGTQAWAALGEGSGATMSDDEDELQMDFSLDQSDSNQESKVREEILRKRRAGKLPGDTECAKELVAATLKEEDKAKLVEKTGLQLKQINNWFINQRKRNWHSNSQSLKSKRKSSAKGGMVDNVEISTSFCLHHPILTIVDMRKIKVDGDVIAGAELKTWCALIAAAEWKRVHLLAGRELVMEM
ncbi:hypothetical protein SASPL_131036 [Salvia splendens]|uniref:Homeobox domain-containing protein n=1 Tax=Salvia splendens TaxID=180675 RepID=A0A8X8X8D2_SALSN|nr:hypothetical protein SASPL_131036 [Salvia splendens]